MLTSTYNESLDRLGTLSVMDIVMQGEA